MAQDNTEKSVPTLEENLKKALTELLMLHLLSEQERYIGELADTLAERSHGTLSIVFPYAAIYRMSRAGYITESKKRNAPDGRLRQYYRITAAGRAYLAQLLNTYERFSQGVANILGGEVTK